MKFAKHNMKNPKPLPYFFPSVLLKSTPLLPARQLLCTCRHSITVPYQPSIHPCLTRVNLCLHSVSLSGAAARPPRNVGH